MVESPDYEDPTRPTRPVLGSGQARYIGVGSGIVTANGGTGELEVTPDPGELYNIASLFFSCTHSCVQEWRIYVNDVIVHRGEFDVSKFIPFPESGMYVLTSSDTLKLEVVNNDTSNRTMRMNITGTIQEV